MNFHHHQQQQNHHGYGVFPPSFYSQHVVSFQSGAAVPGMGSSGGVVVGGGVGGGFGAGGGGGAMMLPPGAGGFPGNLLDPVPPGLKHDTGLAVDWSFNEQAVLNDALVKFSNEPGMMKYIKIAAFLPEKTVRDVALRCRWMAKKENVKRRKLEENYAGKKIKDRKERIDSSAKANIHLVPPDNVAAYSFMMHHANTNNQFPYEVPAIDSATQHLLEENINVLTQISENLSTCKLENNIDLLSHSRDNMATILNRMSEMPGIMSQMPPLSVSINEDLMNSILPSTNQALMFRTPSRLNLKQEPRC
ncbi:uncharacterized protein M6B38_315000 [Iris pallida]|uniref:Uncharacterized protein n=1 Tax=Iris pallida TaxID=29817 RepID=A0AAX6HG21_IRIPA|nr:uncharacterized protein M6B38_315000 [Iris pallida]